MQFYYITFILVCCTYNLFGKSRNRKLSYCVQYANDVIKKTLEQDPSGQILKGDEIKPRGEVKGLLLVSTQGNGLRIVN